MRIDSLNGLLDLPLRPPGDDSRGVEPPVPADWEPGSGAGRALPASSPGPDASAAAGSLSRWGELAAELSRRQRLTARASKVSGAGRLAQPGRSSGGLLADPALSSSAFRAGGAKAPASPSARSAGADALAPTCSCALCQGAALLAGRDLRHPFGAAAVTTPKSAAAGLSSSQRPGLLGAPSASGVAVASSLAIRDADVFLLESNPGADKTIYLNFVGANLTGTAWDTSSWNGVAPAFSLDSDTSTFSASELTAIKEIFARVACDYAPFNINVTTKAPSSDRINRASSSDSIYGTVCLFSNISSQTRYNSAGGVAYVGVFDNVNAEYYKPALVFPSQLSNVAKYIAEAASHEIGHNLGLSHDGTSTAGYYSGQGSSPGWAPIMGVGYYEPLVQFSRGTYAGANNTENDFSIINANGFPYWTDVVGNTAASATALTITDANGDGISDPVRIGGSIELTASNGLATPDRDVYGFQANGNGSVSINIRNALFYYDPTAAASLYAPVPAGYGNIRLDAQLSDANGTILADWSNNGSLDVSNFSVSGLSANQNYYVSVFANANSPDGEDTYGSVGDYILDLVYQTQVTLPSVAVSVSPSTVMEDGSDLISFTFQRSGATDQPLTVYFNIAGTATAGVDYSGTSAGANSIQFAAGASTAVLLVDPTADQSLEADETVSVTLTNGTGYSLQSAAPVVATIANDDVLSYSISAAAAVWEGQRMLFTISAPGAPNGTALSWQISGQGISTADFATALSGTVSLSNGAATVTLQSLADLVSEGSETLLFGLSDANGVQVASTAVQLHDTLGLWGSTGNDTITGQALVSELISGVPSSGTQASQLGVGQVDVVTGGSGPDLFQLSQVRSGSLRVFYDDGNTRNTGTNDYMQIQDFSPTEDILRFAGGRYFTRNNGTDSLLYYDRNNNGTLSTSNNSGADELIAILKNVNLGSNTITSASTFSWVSYV